MSSITNTVYREHNVTSQPGNYGTAKDDHAPIGNVTSSGWRYRDLMRFGVSGPPAGAILDSCVLKLKTTGGVHSSQGSSPRIRIRRCTEDWAASGGGTEQWRSDADPVGFSVSTSSSGEVSYSFGGAENTVYDFDITDYYEYVMSSSVFKRNGTPGGGLSNYGIEIRAGTITPSDETNTNDRCEFYSIRGSYAPRAVITWHMPDAATAPTLVAPSGVLAAAPTIFSFLFPSGDGAQQYELEVGSALDTSDLWNPAVAAVTPGTQKDVTYAGTAIPATGATIHWRVRGLNEVGTAGPWSRGTFSVQSVPTVTLQSSVMAEVHNLGALATWSGSEGKARIKATYNHPQLLNAAAWEVEVAGVVTAFPGGTLPGGTATFDLATGWARNTNVNVRVRAQGTAGQWSAWTALTPLRINWAQGIYTFTYPANATGWAARHAALTTDTTKTKVAYLYRNTSGPGAWQNTPAAATTSTSTSMDMLVRLSSFDPAINPILPLAKLEWSPPGTGGTLDHWQVTGGAAIVVDEGVRRFGVHSVKVTPSATSGWLRNSRGVALTAGQWYTLSAYINTNGVVFGGQGCAVGFNTEAGAYLPPLGAGTGALAATLSTVDGEDGWVRLYDQFLIPGTPGDTVYLKPALWWGNGSTLPYFNVDAFQLEEGEVATGWKPGMAGPAVVMDVGGIAVDARVGGILRLFGSTGGLRDLVELYQKGLRFGGDTELSSPSTGVLHVNGVAIGGGSGSTGLAVRRVYATAGTTAWTKAAAPGCLWLDVEVIGGGGGSGGNDASVSPNRAASGAGGGGGYARKAILVSALAASENVVVGVGGTAAAAGANAGGAGGTSSFAGVSATGGGGGAGMVPTTADGVAPGGAGGVGAGGDLNIPGVPGGHGVVAAGARVPTNQGGGTVLGGGTRAATGSSDGIPGTAYGSGAAGSNATGGSPTRPGAVGAVGVVVITEHY